MEVNNTELKWVKFQKSLLESIKGDLIKAKEWDKLLYIPIMELAYIMRMNGASMKRISEWIKLFVVIEDKKIPKSEASFEMMMDQINLIIQENGDKE